MEGTEGKVKPTWQLAWGLWWRMCLISILVSVILSVVTWFFLKGWMLAKLAALYHAVLGGA